MNFKEYLLSELYSIAKELGINNKINVAEYRSFKCQIIKKIYYL